MINALQQVVLAEKHGEDKPGATGVSIYYPNSQLYRNPSTGAQSYTAVANRFAEDSLWDDFLAFHYLDQTFSQTAAPPRVPSGSYSTRAPGAGQITLFKSVGFALEDLAAAEAVYDAAGPGP